MLELGEEAAAFDGPQLPIVAGEDQFCTGALRFGHQLACDADCRASEHHRRSPRTLSRADQCARPFLSPEQLGVDRSSAGKAARAAQVLCRRH